VLSDPWKNASDQRLRPLHRVVLNVRSNDNGIHR